MSDEPINDPDLRKAIRQALRNTERKSEAERRALIQQAVEQAMSEELAGKRAQSEREAADIRDELTRESPRQEAINARRSAPAIILLLLMLLLILWLIAAATGRTDILPFPGTLRPSPTLRPLIPTDTTGFNQMSVPACANPPAAGSAEQAIAHVIPPCRDYYLAHDGVRMFGLPISAELHESLSDGKAHTVQYFERARLEYWPELESQGYAVQGGRLGAEYIQVQKIKFPTQQPFVSLPNVRYFPETSHGVSDRFLAFWNQNDGMRILGYPISDQIQEVLSDNAPHTVQYFERGRLEHHPECSGNGFEMQLGLLGKGMFANADKSKGDQAPTSAPGSLGTLNENPSKIIPPAPPTPVPLPASAPPTPVPSQ
jgi:hypothetical protein